MPMGMQRAEKLLELDGLLLLEFPTLILDVQFPIPTTRGPTTNLAHSYTRVVFLYCVEKGMNNVSLQRAPVNIG